ncbi:MAG: DNA adenine methylase [Oscillospiraceae bacterium]|nr:DNA adenine methylase [Oscillospiraceae bacterium]
MIGGDDINSPISWKGGKKLSLKYILPRFPVSYSQYIEVFGGGGWVFFAKKPETNDIYNDYNRHLSNMFACIKNKTISLIKELGFLPFAGRNDFIYLRKFLEKEEFNDEMLREEADIVQHELPPLQAAEVKAILTEETERYDVKRAAAMFKVIRYSYASSCTSFGCRALDIRRFFHLIWDASRRMADALVENQDFETLVRHYDNDTAFFYLDPPYFDAEDYEVAFPKEDHVRLRDLLMSIDGKFMLSYNDSPAIRELYEGQDGIHLFEFERLDSIAQRAEPGKMYKELLIANYDMNESMNSKPAQLSLFDITEEDEE